MREVCVRIRKHLMPAGVKLPEAARNCCGCLSYLYLLIWLKMVSELVVCVPLFRSSLFYTWASV